MLTTIMWSKPYCYAVIISAEVMIYFHS